MKRSTRTVVSAEDRLEQAADWFVALQGRDGSDLPAAELPGWDRWIADPDNRAAFDRLAHRWQEAGMIERPPLPDEEDLLADDFDGFVPVAHWSTRGPTHRRPLRFFAAAAALILVVAALGFGLRAYWPVGVGQSIVQETGAGEHRELKLPDGSTIAIGARSTLSVQYTAARRTIVLDRGEALFDVARDPLRPFVVFAGKGTITALGTTFNVLRDTERVVVTVAEGAVEVDSKAAPTPARLARGEEIVYDSRGERGVVKQIDPRLATGWREGRLRYRQEALRHVVEDVNRYSQRTILLDPQAGELRFTGTVFRDQIEEWTEGLQRIFPVEIVEADAQHVLIRLHEEAPQP